MATYDHFGDVIEPGDRHYMSCVENRTDYRHIASPDAKSLLIERYHVPLVWEKEMIHGMAHWFAMSAIQHDGAPLYWRLDPVVENQFLEWVARHDGVLSQVIHGGYLTLGCAKMACNDANDLIRAGLAGEGYPAILVDVV